MALVVDASIGSSLLGLSPDLPPRYLAPALSFSANAPKWATGTQPGVLTPGTVFHTAALKRVALQAP